jgi:hypothetical protein
MEENQEGDEEMKPIEPGCLAITIGLYRPESNGIVVRVIRKLGDYHPWDISKGSKDRKIEYDDCWEIDRPIKSRFGKMQPRWPSKRLMRIDDSDDAVSDEVSFEHLMEEEHVQNR